MIHQGHAGAIDQVVDAAVFLAHVRKELNNRRLIGDVNPAVLIVVVTQVRLVATAADDDAAGGESVLGEKPADALATARNHGDRVSHVARSSVPRRNRQARRPSGKGWRAARLPVRRRASR